MLKKLIHHEFRFYNKFMLLALLVMAVSLGLSRIAIEVMDQLTTQYEGEVFNILLEQALSSVIILTVFCGFAVLFLPNILTAIRYYKNLISDEGYLSFTLPVQPWKHVFTKTVVPFIWSVLAGIILVSLCLLILLPGNTPPLEPTPETEPVSPTVWLLVIWSLVVLILSALSSILQIVFSLSLGQLFRKHKLIGSIGCYIGLNAAIQFVSGFVSVFPIFFLAVWENLSAEAYFAIILGTATVIYLALIITFYTVSCRIMTKKLNLQ